VGGAGAGDMTPPEPMNDGAPDIEQGARAGTTRPLVVHCRADGILTFANDAFCRAVREARANVLGQSFWSLLPARERARGQRHVRSLTPDAPAAVIEYLVVSGPEDVHVQRWTDHARFDARGRLIEWLAVGEILPAGSADWQREREATLTAAILAALTDRFILFSSGGDYLYSRTPDTPLSAGTPDGVAGHNIRDVLPPATAARWQAAFDWTLATGEISTLEYTLPEDGEERVYEARIARCTPRLLVALIRDRTIERHGAEALARAETEVHDLHQEMALLGKVASMGVLAGAIAHELNQPLMSTATNVQAALKFLNAPVPDLEEARAAVADIGQSTRRVSEMIRHLFAKLRTHASEHIPLDLNAVAADVIRLVQRQARSRGVTIDMQFAPDLPLILGDRIQLHQVVLNLLLNACDAVHETRGPNPRVLVRTERSENAAGLSVVDSGAGIPIGDMTRVFEPFYTTKPHGTGLGLALSRTILTLHGGRLYATRNPGGGMTFAFTLKAVTMPAGRTQASGGGASR
jgi:signal transduction histidine kinase